MTGVLTQKKRFDLKIKEMRAGQAKNVTMFNNTKYEAFLEKLKELKNPGYKMTP